MEHFLKDMLQDKYDGKMRYSQGRVYLFISIALFLLTNIYILVKSYIFGKFGKELDLSAEKMVVDALEWIVGAFALYVLGGKTVGLFDRAKNGTNAMSTAATQQIIGEEIKPKDNTTPANNIPTNVDGPDGPKI